MIPNAGTLGAEAAVAALASVSSFKDTPLRAGRDVAEDTPVDADRGSIGAPGGIIGLGGWDGPGVAI